VSTDLQVCVPQEVIPLSAISVVPNFSPRTLDIRGDDFSSIDQVLINDIAAPEVVVMSRTRLLAQVPPSLFQTTVTSVTVVANRLFITPKSLIRFRLLPTPGKVSGIMRLVQIYLKILFTTPGTDIFAPRIGGAALKNVGQTFGKDEGGGVVSDLIIAVNTTQRQIVAIQSRDPSIPRDERLLAAKVTSAGFNKTELALIASIEITSQAGQAVTASLMM
jgi:hypothetical protein